MNWYEAMETYLSGPGTYLGRVTVNLRVAGTETVEISVLESAKIGVGSDAQYSIRVHEVRHDAAGGSRPVFGEGESVAEVADGSW